MASPTTRWRASADHNRRIREAGEWTPVLSQWVRQQVQNPPPDSPWGWPAASVAVLTALARNAQEAGLLWHKRDVTRQAVGRLLLSLGCRVWIPGREGGSRLWLMPGGSKAGGLQFHVRKNHNFAARLALVGKRPRPRPNKIRAGALVHGVVPAVWFPVPAPRLPDFLL